MADDEQFDEDTGDEIADAQVAEDEVAGDRRHKAAAIASDDTSRGPVAAAVAPALRRNGKPKRISRWDRPPEPHDWRWVVGHIGRAMITIGLLMFGFVAYQLWGTGLETARAQNDLDGQFESFAEDNGVVFDTLTPPTSTTIDATDGTSGTETTDPATTDPATTAPATTVQAEPVPQDYGDIDPGDALAKMIIPAIDFDWKVVAGVAVKDLAKGPGHFPDTPLPGQYGNSAVAGHRTGHGGPFFDLDKLEPGDEIQVYTKIGGAYAYVVTDSLVVSPSDYHVITDSDPTIATLTLVTCEPKYTSNRRLIVHATLDPTRGSPVGEPLILAATPTEPVLPDDPTATDPSTDTDAASATTAATDTTDVAATDASTTGSTDATGTTTESASGATVDTTGSGSIGTDANEFAAEDAFSQGWFDDGRAWPHVVGWAVLLGVIAYGAYRLAKRFRHLYLAFVVGFVPFVAVLYFFYQNVNRLLPAAI